MALGQSTKHFSVKAGFEEWNKKVNKISLKKYSWIKKFWWFGCHEWVVISFFISEVETREPHRIFYQHHWCNNNYRQLLLLLCLTRNGHPDPFQPFLGFIQLWSFNTQKSKIHLDPCCQKLSFNKNLVSDPNIGRFFATVQLTSNSSQHICCHSF